MTWTRYKQAKLFKTQINDPTVQGCPKCLVLLKIFYDKPDFLQGGIRTDFLELTKQN